MIRHAGILTLAVLGLAACQGDQSTSTGTSTVTPTGTGTETAGAGGADVRAVARAWNEKATEIPSRWKKGHASPRKLHAGAVRRTESGFAIQLPSRAPVPTPT